MPKRSSSPARTEPFERHSLNDFTSGGVRFTTRVLAVSDMRHLIFACVLAVACGSGLQEKSALPRSAALFDCNAAGQRLSCGDPADQNKRFVCHGTPAG